MAAADAIATVSLPWLGQRPAETYEQLCSSLLALDDAVEEVFGRVERRCASETQKLAKLEERIASAQERARRMAVLPQSSSLAFAFEVQEVVAMGRMPHASGQRRDADIHRMWMDAWHEGGGVDV